MPFKSILHRPTRVSVVERPSPAKTTRHEVGRNKTPVWVAVFVNQPVPHNKLKTAGILLAKSVKGAYNHSADVNHMLTH